MRLPETDHESEEIAKAWARRVGLPDRPSARGIAELIDGQIRLDASKALAQYLVKEQEACPPPSTSENDEPPSPKGPGSPDEQLSTD